MLDYNRFMFTQHKAEHIYIHIPFCIRKCRYCDFRSIPHDCALEERYVRAVLNETALRKNQIGRVTTIFFGGGTPSILAPVLLTEIMHVLKQSCEIDADAEITVEANPATMHAEKSETLKTAGFNRISIGVQSVHARELATLGRMHDWNDVMETCALVRSAGFSNLSLDLMYGLPGQSVESWLRSLEHVIALNPDHISAYELTPERETPLFGQLSSGAVALPSEEAVAEMYTLADELLANNRYEHYEISNYAQPARRCRHNMAYWQRKSYIGLGAAAHSFDGHYRSANTDDIIQYMERIEQGGVPVIETIELTSLQALQETVFLGLRTADGIARSAFEPVIWQEIEKALQDDTLQGLAEITPDRLRLTSRGWLVSNQVIASILSGIEKLPHGR